MVDVRLPIETFPEVLYEIQQELPEKSIVHNYTICDDLIHVFYTEPNSERIKQKIIKGLDFDVEF